MRLKAAMKPIKSNVDCRIWYLQFFPPFVNRERVASPSLRKQQLEVLLQTVELYNDDIATNCSAGKEVTTSLKSADEREKERRKKETKVLPNNKLRAVFHNEELQ